MGDDYVGQKLGARLRGRTWCESAKLGTNRSGRTLLNAVVFSWFVRATGLGSRETVRQVDVRKG